MDWTTVAQLIITIGLPAVERLISNMKNNTPVTIEEIQQLIALASRSSQDRMKAALVSAGYTLDDPRSIALLKLTAGPPIITTGSMQTESPT